MDLLQIPHLEITGPGLVLVLGATGSGKTTLLRSASGVSPALAGLETEGLFRHVGAAPRIGYVPQDAIDGFLSFDVAHEFLLRARAAGRTLDDARPWAARQVASLEFAAGTGERLVELSAGQRRRVAIAAAQAQDPEVLLLDEPYSHVDATWRPRITQALAEAARRRLVLVTTHEPRPLLPHARRAIVLRQGKVVFDGTPTELIERAAAFPEVRITEEKEDPVPVRAHEPALIQVEGLGHRRGRRHLFDGLDLRVGVGLHALVGPNGSGKTSLLRLLMGLEYPTRGRIRVGGKDPTKEGPAGMSRVATLVVEEPTRALFCPTVADEVAFTPANHQHEGCEVTARVREALSDLELDPLRERAPLTLSGGEKERLALACALAAQTAILLLDEPTQGLDVPGRRLLNSHLRRLSRQRCIIVATHDEELAALAQARLRLIDGRIALDETEVAPRTLS